MKLKYFTNIKDGHFQKNVRALIQKDLKSLKEARYEITIEKVKSKRSLQQNKLWWVYMTILSKDIGYTKEEIHAICKMKFLKREKVIEGTGEILEYLESTTTLNKSDFSDMTSELIRWAAETFDIVLPLPESQIDMNL